MEITFADGTSITATSASTPTSIVCVVATKAEVATIWDGITVDNLKSFTLDDTTYSLYIPVSMSAVIDEDSGNITATFVNRAKTTAELQAEQISALEEAVTAMAEA